MPLLGRLVVGVVTLGVVAAIAGNVSNNAPKKPSAQKPPQENTNPSNTQGTPLPPSVSTGSTSVYPSNQVASWGFEKETVIETATTKSNHDALRAALLSGVSGDIPIQYEGGTVSDRFARIVPDPTQAGNHILHFWLKNARVPGARAGYQKGRIQLHLSGINKPESLARFRMYLSPDLAAYRTYPKENHWFTISELWSRPSGNKHFRITLNLAKEAGAGKPLRFVVSADKQAGGTQGAEVWKNIWGTANTQFEVPVGEWIDMEIGYKQGNAATGRFYLSAKRSSDAAPIGIFDITDWTYNPDASAPSLLTEWDIFKLYTSGEIIDFVRNQGGVAQIYWDDLELFDSWSK